MYILTGMIVVKYFTPAQFPIELFCFGLSSRVKNRDQGARLTQAQPAAISPRTMLVIKCLEVPQPRFISVGETNND